MARNCASKQNRWHCMSMSSPRPRLQAAKTSLNVAWDNKFLQALDTSRQRPLICNLLQQHYIDYPVKASESKRKLGNSESAEMIDCMKKKNVEHQRALFGDNLAKINEWKRASGRYSAELLDVMINEIMLSP
ncbi:hypothetical protein GUITHDRAFT_122630 [Guillardia theta CCMP2712]|uniref:Uncharacterized protein n=1 Tax=Guillardia theta (strain CCMP2712) TaxID=905079 RepID=L1I4J2_GUITC|nr:hypothetical protein GUITHDRAFT_122630 [Guillardia theta CCMP2712]EKX31166.1 hypothetical protein GUITHDRAFT_122630 [Guillardia theta CCMP2712]|eukprot:XP_005818146.1 hypothetical protein GUITHDRAFT_122630 [Guillardia theta CCMP2712]